MSAFFSGALSVLIMVLILSVLITIHEFGHYIMARLCGIRVREFAIGMGPAFYKRQKRDEDGNPVGTAFSLRVFPIGGYCDMGEDEESDDPAHFRNKKNRKKFLVLVSGAVMNFLIGIVLFIVMYMMLIGNYQNIPTIDRLDPAFPYADKIQAGDRIVEINGNAIFSYMDLSLFIDRGAGEPYTFVVERDGQRHTVRNVDPLLGDEDNPKFGFTPGIEEITLPVAIREGFVSSIDSVRIVWISLGDLFSGRAGVTDMMGPVGMGDVVNDIVTSPGTDENPIDFADRFGAILNLAGLIAVNLAVVNLLPIPALDGGRIVFLFISWVLVKVRKKPLSSKLEGYIHGGTMLLLFGLMIFIFFNDIRRIIGL